MTPTLTNCLNCDAALTGDYCPRCGQSIKGPQRLFWTVLHEAFENVFQLNSRATRTFAQILFLPGRVARRYLDGKRVSFVHPLRLYIVSSIIFFVVLSALNFLQSFDSENTSDGSSVDVLIQLDDDQNFAKGAEGAEGTQASDQAETEIPDVSVNLPWLTKEESLKFESFVSQQVEKVSELSKDDPGEIISQILEIAPPLVFALLPLMALVLLVLLSGRGFFYAEHLIFTVYNHCFLFLLLSMQSMVSAFAISWLSDLSTLIMSLWIPIYLVLSFKHVYKLGWFATLWRLPFVFISYMTLVAAATTLLFTIGLLTI